jgi:hypothetical protein
MAWRDAAAGETVPNAKSGDFQQHAGQYGSERSTTREEPGHVGRIPVALA